MRVFASNMAAKKWDMAAAVASHLVKTEPETSGWCINLAYARKCSRQFLCDLFKPAGFKDDLRPCVVNDVARELLAFYDQACIGEARRSEKK